MSWKATVEVVRERLSLPHDASSLEIVEAIERLKTSRRWLRSRLCTLTQKEQS